MVGAHVMVWLGLAKVEPTVIAGTAFVEDFV